MSDLPDPGEFLEADPSTNRQALHATGLNMLYRCQKQFEKRYIEGRREAPGLALVVGGALHEVARIALQRKRDVGDAMSIEEAKDTASLMFDTRWSAEEVDLDDEQKLQGAPFVRAFGKDQTVALAKLYVDVVLPQVNPVLVEEKIRIEVPGFRYDWEGALDLTTTEGYLPDTKTTKQRLTFEDVYASMQLDFYDVLYTVRNGTRPTKVGLVSLQKVADRKKYEKQHGRPPAEILLVDPTDTHDVIFDRVRMAERVIESGNFAPVNPSSFWCSTKWCGYARTDQCAYGPLRRRKSLAVNPTPETTPES